MIVNLEINGKRNIARKTSISTRTIQRNFVNLVVVIEKNIIGTVD